jgi:hypothetical protein
MNILTEVKNRAMAPTPPFFQFLKKAGLIIAAFGIAVISAPGALPAVLLTYAGHAVTAGTILVTISQLTVDDAKIEDRLMQSLK